jgi:hypothetical protein
MGRRRCCCSHVGVTYAEVIRLPNHVSVTLKDGQRGRIVSWLHRDEAVSIEVGVERRIISCRHLVRRPDGTVAELPESATSGAPS